MQKKQIAINISLVVSILMLIGKTSAYFLTGSAAILSDASESVVHIFVTCVSLLSIRFADKPPDARHPYGHGRIVLFSIGIEGLLVFCTAIFILVNGIDALINGSHLQKLDSGLLLIFVLTIINLALGVFLVRVGKKENSPALVANGKHVLADMMTSAVVIVGLTAVWLTGFSILDPIVALMAGTYVLFAGASILREAANLSMDEASTEDTERINLTLDALVKNHTISEYHQLRHRRINNEYWIEVHVLVPKDITISDAHERASLVERQLEQLFPTYRVCVTSHIEPEDHCRIHPEGHRVDPLSNDKK